MRVYLGKDKTENGFASYNAGNSMAECIKGKGQIVYGQFFFC